MRHGDEELAQVAEFQIRQLITQRAGHIKRFVQTRAVHGGWQILRVVVAHVETRPNRRDETVLRNQFADRTDMIGRARNRFALESRNRGAWPSIEATENLPRRLRTSGDMNLVTKAQRSPAHFTLLEEAELQIKPGRTPVWFWRISLASHSEPPCAWSSWTIASWCHSLARVKGVRPWLSRAFTSAPFARRIATTSAHPC